MGASQCCHLLWCVPWLTSPGRAISSDRGLSSTRNSVQARPSTKEAPDPNQLSALDSRSPIKISVQRRVGSFPQSLRRFNSLITDNMAQEKSLKSLLMEKKVEMKYDRERMSQIWLPFDAIEDILRSDEGQNSLRTIPGDNNKLRAFVEKSKRLWALLVQVNRLRWLESFCDADFDDSLFPIKRNGNWNIQSCSSNKIVAMPGTSGDDETAFDSIEDQQWQFFVPIFGPERFACVFDYHCKMPFVKEFRTEDTNFSSVTEFVIHRKHLDLDFRTNDQIVRDNLAIICCEIGANACCIGGGHG